jgi:hypothetical protein
MLPMLTLVVGGDAGARERAIAERIAESGKSVASTALILEGMPTDAVNFDASISVSRIAPGCPCCTGRLTMQVTLNRVLRHPPEYLYISVADATHLDAIRDFLTQSPYDSLLTLNDNLLI